LAAVGFRLLWPERIHCAGIAVCRLGQSFFSFPSDRGLLPGAGVWCATTLRCAAVWCDMHTAEPQCLVSTATARHLTPPQRSHNYSLIMPFAAQSQSTVAYAETHLRPITQFAITPITRPVLGQSLPSSEPPGLPTNQPVAAWFRPITVAWQRRRKRRKKYHAEEQARNGPPSFGIRNPTLLAAPLRRNRGHWKKTKWWACIVAKPEKAGSPGIKDPPERRWSWIEEGPRRGRNGGQFMSHE
jgi:hypothetical protein